jgi:hypothetical protein
MTFAEFIAACFWPTVGLFGLLLTRTRDHVLRQYITMAAIVMFFLYFVLAIVGANSSMIAVIDLYVLAGVLGLLVLGYGYNRWGHDKPGAPSSFKESVRASASSLLERAWFGSPGAPCFRTLSNLVSCWRDVPKVSVRAEGGIANTSQALQVEP